MIYETIITTRNADGKEHIAPMGVQVNDTELILSPFKPSQTLKNLLRERRAVINYTDDVRIFAGCLSDRHDWPLISASKIDGIRLTDALAHAEINIIRIRDDPGRPRLFCEVVHEETHAPFRGFNRAQAAIIELAILVSRLQMLPWDKVEQEMKYLQIAIDKTAGERETTAWNWLVARVNHFKREQGINEQTARERT